MRFVRMFLIAATALAAMVIDAEAIVGRSEPAGANADGVVMVLSRGAEGSGFCTGVVLSARVVLTAAHCLRAPGDTLVLYRDDAGQPITVAIAATATHPRYHADAIKRRVVSIDLGLLQTATALPPRFRPTLLADRAVEIGESTTLVGFGVAREGEPKTGGTARATALRVRAPASALLLWAEDPRQGGAGGCTGDSGAPLFAADNASVLAIVAWTAGEKGHKCGSLTQGPLLAPTRAWIDGVRAKWGGG
jgi:hypothetical protein